MDNKDHSNIQELIHYVESRFRKILFAMDGHRKAPGNRHKWMDSCLHQEVVSNGFIKIFSIFLIICKPGIHSNYHWSGICYRDGHRYSDFNQITSRESEFS